MSCDYMPPQLECDTTFALRDDIRRIQFGGLESLKIIYQKYFQPYDVVTVIGERTIYFGLMAYGDFTEHLLKTNGIERSIYSVMGFDNCVDYQIAKAIERLDKFIEGI